MPGGHLAANISFRAHFLHIFVLISLCLAEAKGGWNPLARPAFAIWGHNSNGPPLSAGQPTHKAVIKKEPGTQTKTSIIPDQQKIERKRAPKMEKQTEWQYRVSGSSSGPAKVQVCWPLLCCAFVKLCFFFYFVWVWECAMFILGKNN